MGKIIQLANIESNFEYINKNSIERVTKLDGVTCIQIKDRFFFLKVRESPERVVELIENDK